ncbi:MAG: replication initiation factor domain-containing protein [Microcoleus sp. PH2017_40_RAT_O_B]|uniref:replication initiation factor domain-containing protein n=1 Tax=unclassified Microcoleus TaxID=2642155 RepID=UPI001D5FA024|nr:MULTISPECIES: replication initiation factor domain-containing protein [unclassified Microcoleus]MCC3575247.1 replication initiation factor domain-containing protein [Microcoleus sp. PH2017_34_RAT_O_A]MCC3612825.1 replication initiation factor domain-containing protein [Microcoleus sp. PH2017_40_RAT_O_B]
MEQEYLPRNIKIDWLRFQFETSAIGRIQMLLSIIKLPFEKKQQQMPDVRDTNVLALNKIWHEVYEFQGSLMGVYYAPSSGTDVFHRYFVDLNGSALDSMSLEMVHALLLYVQFEHRFTANRIDIALDFPLQSPRLSMRYWEGFIEDGLLVGYRAVRRVMSRGGNRPGTTVYLGSRQSDRFVRIYDKNIDGVECDRLEVEFKRSRALWVMQQIANSSPADLLSLLNGVVCGQINFARSRSDVDFFKSYKYGPVSVPAPQLHLDIERSIAFVQRHSATFAMLEEFMGSLKYDEFMRSVLAVGKLRMKPRHRSIIANAKFLGVTVAGVFFILLQTSGAIASGLVCPATPAPVSLGSQMVQKFPIDIAMPNATEQAYLNAVGDGCFQVNSGLNFDRICLPGMIVNALRPFVIMGLGIKFIFGD